MHEFLLINDLMRKIESIARELGAQRVACVKVKPVALSYISPEHFREHFEAVAKGTIADGGSLEIETLTDEYDPPRPRTSCSLA